MAGGVGQDFPPGAAPAIENLLVSPLLPMVSDEHWVEKGVSPLLMVSDVPWVEKACLRARMFPRVSPMAFTRGFCLVCQLRIADLLCIQFSAVAGVGLLVHFSIQA